MPNLEQLARVDAAREKVNTETLPALLEAFAGKAEQIPPTPDQIPQVWVAADSVAEVAKWLKGCGFNMLVDLTCADYHPNRDPRFDVVYMFRQFPALGMIRLRVKATEATQVPSLTSLWPMANAAEREVWDQFGIKFKGHPNLTRILNPDDWEGHPLRRDYPLHGPRALINQEMPAEQNRYAVFADEDDSRDGK